METNPPPPYPGQTQPVHVNVINVQPVAGHYVTGTGSTVLIGQPVGTEPALVVCQSCRHQVITTIEMRPTARTHLWAFCLFIVGCWPCMCIPYCTPSCMNIDHYCPNCRGYIGKYEYWRTIWPSDATYTVFGSGVSGGRFVLMVLSTK